MQLQKIRESLKELLLEELRKRFVEQWNGMETTDSIAIKLSWYLKAKWKSLVFN